MLYPLEINHYQLPKLSNGIPEFITVIEHLNTAIKVIATTPSL